MNQKEGKDYVIDQDTGKKVSIVKKQISAVITRKLKMPDLESFTDLQLQHYVEARKKSIQEHQKALLKAEQEQNSRFNQRMKS